MQNHITHQSNWTQSALGHNIELYLKKHTESEKIRILFVGGVHGDEPEGVRLANELLLWLKKQDQSQLINWALIPCLCVDGYYKNPPQRMNGNGVDLNRNFPSKDWSNDSKGPRYYPGPHPGSESETKALCQFIDSYQPHYIIHFHSWEPSIVYTGVPGKKIAEILKEGNEYKTQEDIGYPTPGSLGQYGWLEKKIPVICIEEKEHISLDLVWGHFEKGLINLLKNGESI